MIRKEKISISLNKMLLKNIDLESRSLGLKRSQYIQLQLKRRRKI